ncbi:hypothetical protein FO519_004386 [Halicephalobus sp. NKZ332]|nr:hypothetical protein FO519_004386 [Halicephalobus sp. NKZ332]
MLSNRFLITDDPKGRQAISNLKNSTMSIYTSTMSHTGFFGGQGSDSAMNLYTLMAKYRCCCGLCRLRIGSFVISVLSLTSALFVIALMFGFNDRLTETQREYLTIPAFVLMGIQFVSSLLMLIGIFSDSHYLLLPYQFSCVLMMMGSMGCGLVLLISADNANSQLYPVFAACSMGMVAVYLWFLVICSMTFVMIRDKKRLADAELDFFEEAEVEPHLERVNSALF